MNSVASNKVIIIRWISSTLLWMWLVVRGTWHYTSTAFIYFCVHFIFYYV